MYLVDFQIRQRRLLPPGDRRRLVLEPFRDYDDAAPPGCVSYGLSSAGYDLRAGRNFLLFTNTSGCVVDPKNFRQENFLSVKADVGAGVVIPPNCFALAETLEYLEIPDDVLVVCLGKSTYARTGYVVPITPFEPGWRGVVTLEVGNLTPLPLRVYAGEGICQMLFGQLAAFPERTYGQKPGARFQDQPGLTGPGGVGRGGLS